VHNAAYYYKKRKTIVMEIHQLLTYGIGILLAIVGFILKQLWADIRENKDNTGKLKGKIELAEQKSDQSIDKIQHVNSLKFKQLNEKLDSMCNDIKEDIGKISDEINLMNRGIDRDENGKFTKRK
jgi:gas vesicle protein